MIQVSFHSWLMRNGQNILPVHDPPCCHSRQWKGRPRPRNRAVVLTLLSRGRTAHSLFRIPIDLRNGSSCCVNIDSLLADLSRMRDVFDWYDTPMAHRKCPEVLLRGMQDIMKSMLPWVGESAVMGAAPARFSWSFDVDRQHESSRPPQTVATLRRASPASLPHGYTGHSTENDGSLQGAVL